MVYHEKLKDKTPQMPQDDRRKLEAEKAAAEEKKAAKSESKK